MMHGRRSCNISLSYLIAKSVQSQTWPQTKRRSNRHRAIINQGVAVELPEVPHLPQSSRRGMVLISCGHTRGISSGLGNSSARKFITISDSFDNRDVWYVCKATQPKLALWSFKTSLKETIDQATLISLIRVPLFNWLPISQMGSIFASINKHTQMPL